MDWTTFTRKIRLTVSILQIYNSWKETTEGSKWFLKQAIITEGSTDDICRKGDKVDWQSHNPEPIKSKSILEANVTEKISFTFSAIMEVYLGISEEGSYSILSLEQTNIPIEDKNKMNDYAGC